MVLKGGMQPVERGLVAHGSGLTIEARSTAGCNRPAGRLTSARRRSWQAPCLHVGPDQIVELASQILSRRVEEHQEFWTDVRLDQPSGISV